MDDDALGFSETKRALQHASLAGEWKMAHFPRRSAAALGGDEFVVLPKCAIEKGEIALVDGALPVLSKSLNAGA